MTAATTGCARWHPRTHGTQETEKSKIATKQLLLSPVWAVLSHFASAPSLFVVVNIVGEHLNSMLRVVYKVSPCSPIGSNEVKSTPQNLGHRAGSQALFPELAAFPVE